MGLRSGYQCRYSCEDPKRGYQSHSPGHRPRNGRTEDLSNSDEQEGRTESRRWPLVEDRDGPDKDNPCEHDVRRAEERTAEVCREKGARSGGQQSDRCSHAEERGAKRCDQPEPSHEVAGESAGKT